MLGNTKINNDNVGPDWVTLISGIPFSMGAIKKKDPQKDGIFGNRVRTSAYSLIIIDHVRIGCLFRITISKTKVKSTAFRQDMG